MWHGLKAPGLLSNKNVSSERKINIRALSLSMKVWQGVVCGAAAVEADAPERHLQSCFAGIKSLYWVLSVPVLVTCSAGGYKAAAVCVIICLQNVKFW